LGQLLNFNPDRGLGFDASDGVDFDPRRERLFDHDRDLQFNQDRDLGFGKRGPVFRGFICPACGAAVTETQSSCAECGASFLLSPSERNPAVPSKQPRAAKRPPKQKSRKSEPLSDQPAVSPPAAPAASSPAAGACSRCGARVLTTDTFCWNCGARFGQSESVPLGPQSKEPSATRDWRETGKDLTEYLEK
jgi:hypothetical protein